MATQQYEPFSGKLDAEPQYEEFSGQLDGEPEPHGPLRRGYNRMIQGVGVTASLAAGDSKGAAEKLAAMDTYQRQNPGSKEGRELSAAWQRGDGITGGIREVGNEIAKDYREAKGFGAIRSLYNNAAAMGAGVVEQIPNMAPPMLGMLAGGVAGSAVAPGVGTAAGALAGASLGNTAVEAPGMAQADLQKAGIDPQDTAATAAYIDQHGGDMLKKAGIKGGIIGAVDTATMGAGHFLLAGPARAAAGRALTALGVDTADKVAVKAAMDSGQVAAKMAADPVYAASRTGAGNAARNVGAASLEPAGEFTGEYLGQGVATGQYDSKDAFLEAVSSIGQGAATFAGQKVYGAATNPARLGPKDAVGDSAQGLPVGGSDGAGVNPGQVSAGPPLAPVQEQPAGLPPIDAGAITQAGQTAPGMGYDPNAVTLDTLPTSGELPVIHPSAGPLSAAASLLAGPDGVIQAPLPVLDEKALGAEAAKKGGKGQAAQAQSGEATAGAQTPQRQSPTGQPAGPDIAQQGTNTVLSDAGSVQPLPESQPPFSSDAPTVAGPAAEAPSAQVAVEPKQSQPTQATGTSAPTPEGAGTSRSDSGGAGVATSQASSTPVSQQTLTRRESQSEKSDGSEGEIADRKTRSQSKTASQSHPEAGNKSPASPEAAPSQDASTEGPVVRPSTAQDQPQYGGTSQPPAKAPIVQPPAPIGKSLTGTDPVTLVGKPENGLQKAIRERREAKASLESDSKNTISQPPENVSASQSPVALESKTQRQSQPATQGTAPVDASGIAGKPAAVPAVEAVAQGAASGTAVDEKAHTAATSPRNDLPEPTDAQKKAGNYAKGHLTIGGLDVSIENPAGSVRSGKDKTGKAWQNTLAHHYGYFKGTVGNDKDHVDVFIKPDTPADYAGPVFVVDQIHPDTGRFDEHKILMGFGNALQARQAYQKNYAKGWKGLKAITPMPMDEFKVWVKDGPKNKPLAQEKAAPAPAMQPSATQDKPPNGLQKRIAENKAEKELQGAYIGRENTPMGEGGKPFETNKAARDAKKNQPMLRVVRVAGGFALAPKTEAQIDAQEKNARRLSVPRFGNPGVPLAAHEFIVGKGGLAKSTRSDMGIEGNPRVGNRFLFAGQGGLDMDSATELLKEAGYLPDGASMDDARNVINRSLRTPQYTSDGIEAMAEREMEDRRKAFEAEQEAIAILQDLEDNEWDATVDAFDKATLDMPQGLSQSDMDMEDALLVAGYTRQEIEDEQRESAAVPESDQGFAETPTGNGPQGDRGREGAPGQDSQAGSQEGLTAPTRADVLRQQDRAANEQALDDKAQIDKAAAGQTLTAQTAPEQRKDTSGDMFAMEKAQAVIDKRNKGGKESSGPSLFARSGINAETRTENFKRWSNDAPLVSSADAETYSFKTGQKVVVEAYHGTKRPDRVGTVFQRKRATSGPMAFFTSAPDLASSYATGKNDTSLANEDNAYENWFKYKPPGSRSTVGIDRAWYSLPSDVKERIAARLPDIRTNDDGDVIYEEGGGDIGSYQWELKQTQLGYDKRGNPLKAAVETWLNSGAVFGREEEFMDVLRLAGFPMKEVEYDSPNSEYPFVYKTFIQMQRPLVTSDVPQTLKDALQNAAKRDRSRPDAIGADMWDKNTRSVREWVAIYLDDKNNSATYVWTSIPDKVTEVLKNQGYDGIIDWSGKGGGTQHPVYIPFAETQVKSAIGNKGKFDPDKKDIRFARSPFYSALSREVGKISAKSQGGIGWAMNIAGLVKAGKVKQDEVNWTGVLDWLRLQDGKVSREQIGAYLDANGVQVQETVLGEPQPPTEEGLAKRKAVFDEYRPRINPLHERAGDFKLTPDERHDARMDAERLMDERDSKADAAYRLPEDDAIEPKYSQYQLPGGTNYREVLLTLPPATRKPRFDVMSRRDKSILHKAESREAAQAWITERQGMPAARGAEVVERQDGQAAAPEFKSSHWDQPNVLAHIRVNDRVDADGKKVLFVEEIQSDWGQAGKKKGFRGAARGLSPIEEARFQDLLEEGRRNLRGTDLEEFESLIARRDAEAENRSAPPAAPFVTKTDAWLSLALKRIVKMAADGGYDRVAFVSGEQSAERYDLSKQISVIEYEPADNGNFEISAQDLNGKEVMHEGEDDGVPLSRIEELVGKEIAQKIANGEGKRSSAQGGYRDWRTLSGLDLKVGGEGMKAFYDTIVPNTLKDVLKKLGGGALETVDIGIKNRKIDGEQEIPTGRPMAVVEHPQNGMLTIELDDGTYWGMYGSSQGQAESQRMADANLKRLQAAYSEQSIKQPGFTLTDAILAKASEDLPQFSRAGGEGVPMADAKAIVAAVREAMPTAPPIHILESIDKAPEELRDDIIKAGAESDVDAAFHNGEIYVFPNNIASIERMAFVVAHHEIRHHGFRSMMGDKAGPIFLAIHATNPKVRELAAEQVAKGYAKSRVLAVEEALADMPVEDLVKLNGFDKIIAALRDWLRSVASNLRRKGMAGIADAIDPKVWTDKDVAALIARAEGVSRGGSAKYRTSGTVFGQNGGVATNDDVAGNNKGGRSAGDNTSGVLTDANGKLLTLYHGGLVWDKFKSEKSGRDALWLTPHVNVASGYADQFNPNEGREIKAFHVTMDKPLDLTKPEVVDQVFGENDAPAPRDLAVDRQLIEQALKYAKANGYDGMIHPDTDNFNRYTNGQISYAVFSEDQLELAPLTGLEQESNTYDIPLRGKPNESTAPNSDGANRFARSTITGQTAKASWDAPEPSQFDSMVYTLQDKQVDTKRVVESIRQASKSLGDQADVYLQEELFHGRAAKRTQDFVDRELRPMLTEMQMRGLNVEQLDEYLHARHAEEANELIAQRNPDLQDAGSGMTTADARAFLAKLDPAQRRHLEAVVAKVDAILKNTRDLYAAYGLESADTVAGWGSMFKHYVPLMREDHDGGMGIGQGFSIKGRETKGRTGSANAKVVDILANIALQRERAIVRGEKNRVSNALIGLAQANPNPDFWAVGPPPPVQVYNPKTNLVEDRVDPLFKSRENVIVAKVLQADGKVVERAVMFNEANERALRMSKSLKNMDATQLEGLLGTSAKITRYFSAVNTVYNPLFGVVNLVRDFQGAIINLSSTPLANHQKQIAGHTLSALKGIYIDARAARDGKAPTSTWAALWEEFQNEGGQTGYRDLFRTSADRADAIKNELDPTKWMESGLGKFFTAGGRLKVPLSIAQKGATGMFGWLSDYNLAMENAVRLAAYKTALEQGMSKQRAASLGKNLTVNFNRRGQAGLQMGALYAFANASMQGSARLAQTLFTMDGSDPSTIRLSRTGKKIVYGGVLLGTMQALLLAAAGFDDEEPPDFVRERSLIIPVGGKNYVTIPMPLGLHILPNLGRIPTEFALGGFKKPVEHVTKLLGLFIDAFNPVGGGASLVQTLAPTAIDPIVALAENRDWTGKPIAKTSYNRATPGHKLARDTASAPARFLSESINFLSGGTDHVRGVFSPTPDQIDYLWGQVTGGVGREANKIDQTVTAAFSGEALPPYKIPLIGRFYGNADSQSSQASSFYANLNRINEHEAEVKGLRKEGKGAEAAQYVSENPDARLIMAANAAERQVQKMRTHKRDLMARDAPASQIREVERQISARMLAFNETVRRLREKSAA